MPLTRQKPRRYQSDAPPHHIGYRVAGGSTIHGGAALAIDTQAGFGFAAPLAYSATKVFIGFAEKGVDNADGSAGDVTCQVRTNGLLHVKQSDIAGADPEDVGDTVYMTDDDDAFTMTSTNAVPIGTLAAVDETTGVAVIAFQGVGVRSV